LIIQGNAAGYKLGFAEGDGQVTFTADVDSAALSVAPAGYEFDFCHLSFSVLICHLQQWIFLQRGIIRRLQHWERKANSGSSRFCLLEADTCYMMLELSRVDIIYLCRACKVQSNNDHDSSNYVYMLLD